MIHEFDDINWPEFTEHKCRLRITSLEFFNECDENCKDFTFYNEEAVRFALLYYCLYFTSEDTCLDTIVDNQRDFAITPDDLKYRMDDSFDADLKRSMIQSSIAADCPDAITTIYQFGPYLNVTPADTCSVFKFPVSHGIVGLKASDEYLGPYDYKITAIDLISDDGNSFPTKKYRPCLQQAKIQRTRRGRRTTIISSLSKYTFSW